MVSEAPLKLTILNGSIPKEKKEKKEEKKKQTKNQKIFS